MESIYLWPENPVLSLLLIGALSMLFLWAAREPMLQVLRGLGRGLESGFTAVSQWCKAAAERQERRCREALLAAGEVELRARMERELHRIDASFSEHVHHVYLQLLPLFRTKDFREGLAAFLQKRDPSFEGQ